MRFRLLNTKNPEYHATEWRELSDFYDGGYALQKRAQQYLPRYLNENPQRYQERLKCSAYIPYLATITDFFVANLFSQELKVQPASDASREDTLGSTPNPDKFYDVFSADADRNGNSFAKVLRGCFLTGILKKKALIAVDFPSQDELEGMPVNRAEEEAIGLDRGYCYEIPVEEMIDWEVSDDKEDEFEWCVLKRTVSKRRSLEDERDKIHDEFRVWRLATEGDERSVTCTLYRTPDRKPGEKVDPELEITGITIETRGFKRIPIVQLHIPTGLWVGNKIGLLAKEHFQRRSALVSAEGKSLMAIPYVKLGPEMSAVGDAIPSEVQQNPHRGKDPIGQFKEKGWTILGKDDNMGFAEPAGTSYELTQKELEKLVDEMYRVVHQMASSVANTKQGLYRSAASKMQDRFTTEIVLAAYGSYVKEAARKVYTILSEARGENVVWNPVGLDKYDLEDRTTIIQETAQLAMIDIPSKTFRKEYLFRTANSLLGNVPPETQAVIKDELEKAVDAEGDLRDVTALPMVNPPPEADGIHPPVPVPGGGEGEKKIPKRGPGGHVVGSVSVGGT